MSGWTIKDSTSSLMDVGEYDMRLEEIKPGRNKDGDTDTLRFRWKAINDSEAKPQFQNFLLRSDLLGILGVQLAGTGEFGDDEELPPDANALSRVLEDRLVGKVFRIDYKHRADKNSDRVYADLKILGPTSG